MCFLESSAHEKRRACQLESAEKGTPTYQGSSSLSKMYWFNWSAKSGYINCTHKNWTLAFSLNGGGGYPNKRFQIQVENPQEPNVFSLDNAKPLDKYKDSTYSHSNMRSLTHWTGPGIEPASSWILVKFVTTEPQQELPISYNFCKNLMRSLLLLSLFDKSEAQRSKATSSCPLVSQGVWVN